MSDEDVPLSRRSLTQRFVAANNKRLIQKHLLFNNQTIIDVEVTEQKLLGSAMKCPDTGHYAEEYSGVLFRCRCIQPAPRHFRNNSDARS